jgi:hypothetical protein
MNAAAAATGLTSTLEELPSKRARESPPTPVTPGQLRSPEVSDSSDEHGWGGY